MSPCCLLTTCGRRTGYEAPRGGNPKSHFPGVPEPRRMAAKALTVVIREARVQVVSTRSVDDQVEIRRKRLTVDTPAPEDAPLISIRSIAEFR